MHYNNILNAFPNGNNTKGGVLNRLQCLDAFDGVGTNVCRFLREPVGLKCMIDHAVC